MSISTVWAAIPRPARIYFAAVGTLIGTGALTLVTVAATSPSPSPSASPGAGSATQQKYCNDYIGHVAANLGKSQSQVQNAMITAVGQTLQDAVKSGDLTQSQANAIKSRLGLNGNSQVCTSPIGRQLAPGFGGHGGFGGPHLGWADVNILNEYAKVLGISPSDLQNDLRNGQTVQQIASSKGMDENAFRAKLISTVKSDLDPQVKSGNITQNQENAVLQNLQSGNLPFWSQVPHRGFGPRPAPSATP